ncbi:hypothetical protein RB25_11240 [Herbaspirillum rubrisubalbicans]|uniref:Uncharacterized protein n=1 Tax=Herbaspirillum rubrisubalbicans TaxID=80842 RepID=A0ABX9BZD8_9BURK|nr:hypothetical protein [Herbaspirillum rubrisubalbicans]MCP1573125.1 hypothetical protein [Herbaspirillum rubrisubalbicans]RAM63404.1 hypothetical protein RB24_16550 [Herbaspirillum rubrisubalbicans]RAN48361.1 hypothetical protein RB25_11240 [Herbaspirillum rubrisubalbicans]
MTSQFDIKPYLGAGDLRFGMSHAIVEELIGAATRKKTGFLGETTEYRRENGLLTTYRLNTNELVEVGFSRNILELEYEGIKLYTDPPREVFRSLVNIDGNPYESVGFIVLLNLGMTLTGFHDDDDIYQRAVTVFARGRWDGELRDLKPFDFANF